MAEIGTPENPEIIEPGQRRAGAGSPGLPSRWAVARQILRVLFAISLPALGVDMLFGWAFHTAVNYGGALPSLAIILLALPALLLSLVALVANLILWPALSMILLGRSVANPLSDQRFARFKIVTNVRR